MRSIFLIMPALLSLGCVHPSGSYLGAQTLATGDGEISVGGGGGHQLDVGQGTYPWEGFFRLGLPHRLELGVSMGGVKRGITHDAYGWRMAGGLHLRYSLPIAWPALTLSLSGSYGYLPNKGGGGYVAPGLHLGFPIKAVEIYTGAFGGYFSRSEEGIQGDELSDQMVFFRIPLGVRYSIGGVTLLSEWSFEYDQFDYRQTWPEGDSYDVSLRGWTILYTVGLALPFQLLKGQDPGLE